jgi:hypothetical protein
MCDTSYVSECQIHVSMVTLWNKYSDKEEKSVPAHQKTCEKDWWISLKKLQLAICKQ